MGKSDEHILSVILYPDSTTWNSYKQIDNIWDSYNETADIIYILHDKDPGEKPHYHLFIRFKGNVSRTKFQETYDISGGSIFNIKEFREKFQLNPAISKEMIFGWDGCVRYTAHRTESAASKYQYPLNEITANFDYTKYFKELNPDEPPIKVMRRIIKWAKKYSANIEDVMAYVDKNGYDKIYHQRYRQIYDVLSRYTWFTKADYLTSDKFDDID